MKRNLVLSAWLAVLGSVAEKEGRMGNDRFVLWWLLAVIVCRSCVIMCCLKHTE